MSFCLPMVNAWSLLYDEINGTLDEEYPIMSEKYRSYQEVPHPENFNEDITFMDDDGHIFRTDGYPGSIEDSQSLNVDSGPAAIRFGDSMVMDDVYGYHYPPTNTKPQPDLKGAAAQKYQEDKGIRDLKDYVASTYSGHYTNDGSNVQTLDLIHSVGDAESFCRSKAIKYLSRYDKKGQAKRDILKAMHYCLLLYYFSGNTNDEITTRGYETF